MYKTWNMICPICGKQVIYWANCSPNTAKDYWNHGWIRHGKIKQFVHLDCIRKLNRKDHKNEL